MKTNKKFGMLSAAVLLALVSAISPVGGVSAADCTCKSDGLVLDGSAWMRGSKLEGETPTILDAVVGGLGNQAKAVGASALGVTNIVTAVDAQGIGEKNWVYAKTSVGVGVNNKITGKQSAAFGMGNVIGEYTALSEEATPGKGENTFVFGSLVKTAANNAIVLGSDISTVADNSVVIGNKSTSEEANTVSVGTTGGERKIVHVAKGTSNTDAATYGQAITENKSFAVSGGSVTVTTNDGTNAFTITGIGSGGGGTTYSAGDHIDLTGNAISVKTGAVGSGETELVTGDAVYKALAANKEYAAAHGKVEIKTNGGETAFTITGLETSGTDLGDTQKLVDAGLGDTVTDSILSVNDKVSSLSNDIHKVGAGAAALAALRPEGFDPADKWSFAVGYGHYKNANAGALGAFYKPNLDTTVSIGGTIGNGDPMLNAGVSFKLGRRSARLSQNASNSQLVQEVNALRADNSRLLNDSRLQAEKIERLEAQVAALLAKVENR